MALNLASPGILIREVDLTIGRIDGSTGKVGGIVGSFEKGPVGEPTVITGENDLFDQFGQPYDTDKQYETWMVASSYLSYGGTLSVIRADDDDLFNSFVGTASSIKIKSTEHYQELGYQENTLNTATVAARNPGTWADGIRVAIIDGQADQRITFSDVTDFSVGLGVTQAISVTDPALGSLSGHLKGIITGIDSTKKTVDVKVVGIVTTGGDELSKDYNSLYKFTKEASFTLSNSGAGTTSVTVTRGFGGTVAAAATVGDDINSFFLDGTAVVDNAGGVSVSASDTVIGINTTNVKVGADKFFGIGNEVISLDGATIGEGKVTLQNTVFRGVVGTSSAIHTDGSVVKLFTKFDGLGNPSVGINTTVTSVGVNTSTEFAGLSTNINVGGGGLLQINNELFGVSSLLDGTTTTHSTSTEPVDWFDQQTYEVSTATVGGKETTTTAKWNAIADKPTTSTYVSERGGRFDEVHVLVIDAKGTISGNAGTVLEKHLNLSKAKDALFSVGSPSYWRKYLYTNSENIFGLSGSLIGTIKTGFSSEFNQVTNGSWDKDAEGIIFNSSGPQNLELGGGKNYGGKTNLTDSGALNSGVGDLKAGYQIFENDLVNNVDFLLMGGGNLSKDNTRSLANTLIQVAEERKDAVAFISPSRDSILADNPSQDNLVTVLDDDKITTNIIDFFDPIASTTFAVFDSGYKYMYDRFNEVFRYVPLNGDIAGTCARNDINDFPWFSPAGTDRGAILNAVKLPYNPFNGT